MENDNVTTALHWAAREGEVGEVALLLSYGAEINARSERGQTPLFEAVAAGHTEIIQLLLCKGALANVQDEVGETPLHLAAENGQVEGARLLLAYGAVLDARGVGRQSPLFLAIIYRQAEVLELLLEKGAAVNIQSERGEAPLHLAVEGGQIGQVRSLLRYGAEVNMKSGNGQTALSLAVVYRRTGIVALLLAQGADPNIRNIHAGTCLHRAVDLGQTEQVHLLLAYGAEVNAKDREGKTPLFLAVTFGRTEIADLLLQKGATVNMLDKAGKSPLEWAIVYKHFNIIKLLLKCGAYIVPSLLREKLVKYAWKYDNDLLPYCLGSGIFLKEDILVKVRKRRVSLAQRVATMQAHIAKSIAHLLEIEPCQLTIDDYAGVFKMCNRIIELLNKVKEKEKDALEISLSEKKQEFFFTFETEELSKQSEEKADLVIRHLPAELCLQVRKWILEKGVVDTLEETCALSSRLVANRLFYACKHHPTQCSQLMDERCSHPWQDQAWFYESTVALPNTGLSV